MTNKEILQIAMAQSALDINCTASDFLLDKHVIVKSGVGAAARKYYKEPIACNLVSYGNNIVASVRNAIKSGFIPAWVEMTVKPAETVGEMNR